jgi:LysR family nitrogen assimilation transcriptional regulator
VNLKQIEYFVRVGELGSFTRASVSLAISQPSLSRQIRLLETELRQTLLYRNGRGVELTPAGQSFLEHGQAILQTVTRALGALNELRTDLRGRVVIGLPSRVARVLTTPLVKAFRTSYPSASITIAEGLSSVLHEWLLLGRVDLALLVDPARSAELDLDPLHTEELVLVGPRARASPKDVSLQQLGRYPLILPRIPNATRSVLEAAMGKVGAPLRVSAEVDTTQNILELVAAKVGYAVLPRGAVTYAGGDGRFRVTDIRPAVRQHLFLAVSKRRPGNRLAGEVRRLIREANVPALLG